MQTRLSTREALRTTALMLLALALAIWGQRVLTNEQMPLDGPFFYGLAILLFLWAVARGRDWTVPAVAEPGVERREEAAGRLEQALGIRSVPLAVSALAFGVATFLFSGGNRFTPFNVALWLATFMTFIGAFAEFPSRAQYAALGTRLVRPAWSIRITWKTVALVAILLVAFFFRYYQLDRIPAEMTSDHAEKLLDVNDVLNGQFRIFFPRNTGREAFQFYLTALIIRLFDLPVGHLALKLGTALFGFIAIPFTYLLAKELFDEEIGLLAGALLAISQWHVAITRVGLRFPFTAAFAAPTLFFLVRAFKYNRRNDWLLSGLFLGIGLHTYTSMRVVPLLLLVLVGIKLLFDLGARAWRARRAWHNPEWVEPTSLDARFWGNGFAAAGMTLVAFLPLMRYMIDNPQIFWYRVLTRSSDLERHVTQNVWLTFLDNVKNALLMFNVKGDVVWVNTVPGSPELDSITGALFVLGVAYILWRLVAHGDRRTLYLLAALFILLLPSILSIAFPVENPSVVRAGGAPVIVMIIAALPLALAARRLYATLAAAATSRLAGSKVEGEDAPRASAGAAVVVIALVVVLLLSAARLNYNWYFNTYDAQFRQSSWNTTEMGGVVRAFASSVGDMQHAYHVAFPYWADTRNIGINAGDPTWANALLDFDIQKARALTDDPAAKLFLLHPDDQKSVAVLEQTFPNGDLRRYKSRTPNKDFLIFFAPANRSSGR